MTAARSSRSRATGSGTSSRSSVPAMGAHGSAHIVDRALAVHALLGAGRSPAEVQRLAALRQDARERRDWPAADALRSQIEALGWTVQDTPAGPRLATL